jgi:L-rhamnose isomerase
MALWIPDSAKPIELQAAYFCRVCKAEFTERERFQYEHHVVRCGEENHDALMAERAELRKWNTEVDPEWGDYNRDLQARGIDPMRQYDRQFKKSARRLRES